jgi:exopolyphosphatase / guanosine-5'-triphosphate,3'-diphosphate pyrophosphatase
MERVAVIDLGTNTFHLLIVESDGNGSFREIFRNQVYAKLGIGGMERIIPESFERGLITLHQFRSAIEEYGAARVQAFGTAALRTASNGPEFMRLALEQTGIEIELISGDEEARLIYRGASLAVPLIGPQPALIMDIGGGSVEFILANEEGLLWAQSFPVGVAVLFRRFHRSDPIAAEEIEETYRFLTEALAPLFKALERHPVRRLIGAAGTFDVIEAMALPEVPAAPNADIPLEHFPAIYTEVVRAPLAGRLAIPRLPRPRADMIVVAFLLTEFVLRRAQIQEMSVSHYSLKEGMIRELLGIA